MRNWILSWVLGVTMTSNLLGVDVAEQDELVEIYQQYKVDMPSDIDDEVHLAAAVLSSALIDEVIVREVLLKILPDSPSFDQTFCSGIQERHASFKKLIEEVSKNEWLAEIVRNWYRLILDSIGRNLKDYINEPFAAPKFLEKHQEMPNDLKRAIRNWRVSEDGKALRLDLYRAICYNIPDAMDHYSSWQNFNRLTLVGQKLHFIEIRNFVVRTGCKILNISDAGIASAIVEGKLFAKLLDMFLPPWD